MTRELMAQNAMWHDVSRIFFSWPLTVTQETICILKQLLKKVRRWNCIYLLKDKQYSTLPKQSNSTEIELSSDNNVFLFLQSLYLASELWHFITFTQINRNLLTLELSLLLFSAQTRHFHDQCDKKNSNFPADVSSVSSQFDTGLLTGEQVQWLQRIWRQWHFADAGSSLRSLRPSSYTWQPAVARHIAHDVSWQAARQPVQPPPASPSGLFSLPVK